MTALKRSSADTDLPHVETPSGQLEVSTHSFGGMLAAARGGQEWAVAALWRDLHPRLLRYLRVLLPASDVEDVASDVWLEVAAGLGRFDGNWDAFRGWVFTIARLRVIDARRRSRRRRTAAAAPEEVTQLLDAATTAPREASRVELEAVLGWVRRLPQDQAEVLLLRVLGDLSCDQVAAVMGKRSGAVRALQHRAVQRLREEMIHAGVTPSGRDALWESDEPLSA
jgi:RNA polymerase sigma-70 factor, ECF subfamily